jgi:hypothetical protein
MRELGFTGSRTGRVLREVCDEFGIEYSHFRLVGPDDGLIARVVPASESWSEASDQLGYARASGSARATVRKHCRRLGIATSHLLLPDTPGSGEKSTLAPRSESTMLSTDFGVFRSRRPLGERTTPGCAS